MRRATKTNSQIVARRVRVRQSTRTLTAISLLAVMLSGGNPVIAFGFNQDPGFRQDATKQTNQPKIGANSSSQLFGPPNNGQSHRVLVVDETIWGFITARGNNPAQILAQTPYALGGNDWAVWGRPIQTGINGNFYSLIVVRHPPEGISLMPRRWLTGPVSENTSRRDEKIRANWRAYRRLMVLGGQPTGGDWNFRQPPRYSLLNAVRPNPQTTIYRADPSLTDGQTAVIEPGYPGINHEYQVLTRVDGIVVDKQAIASWPISYPRAEVVAIGVNYTKNKSVPEWQRPILAQLAGIDSSDWEYVDYIMHRESTWRPILKNKTSGAYGICQSLPAHKMSTAGDDYMDNPLTQLKWCHDYAQQRYGGWQQAYEFWIQNYWW